VTSSPYYCNIFNITDTYIIYSILYFNFCLCSHIFIVSPPVLSFHIKFSPLNYGLNISEFHMCMSLQERNPCKCGEFTLFPDIQSMLIVHSNLTVLWPHRNPYVLHVIYSLVSLILPACSSTFFSLQILSKILLSDSVSACSSFGAP
jgi:hypothetical protein